VKKKEEFLPAALYEAHIEDLKKEVVYYKNYTESFHSDINKWYYNDLNKLGKRKAEKLMNEFKERWKKFKEKFKVE
jgi:hypothetical protein